MKIHGVQSNIEWENKPANFECVRAMVATADVRPGDLVVLPEMFATGFSMNVAAIAEDPAGETETFLRELAVAHHAFVVGGVVTRGHRDPNKGRNEALAIDPDGALLARYAKRHPFSFAGETNHYEPGDAFATFQWNGFTVTPFICYDLRFPECFRRSVRTGANLYVVIANWPRPRREHWIALLQARAIENQACMVGVNRCGTDPNIEYAGESLILDPRGTILSRAGDAQTVIAAEPDLKGLETYRKEFPALRDMIPDP